MERRMHSFSLLFLSFAGLFLLIKGSHLFMMGVSSLILIAYMAFAGIVLVGLYGVISLIKIVCMKHNCL